jgi:hypothetical protein
VRNRYEYEVRAQCPVNPVDTDLYAFVIESAHLIEVEKIVAFFAAHAGAARGARGRGSGVSGRTDAHVRGDARGFGHEYRLALGSEGHMSGTVKTHKCRDSHRRVYG